MAKLHDATTDRPSQNQNNKMCQAQDTRGCISHYMNRDATMMILSLLYLCSLSVSVADAFLVGPLQQPVQISRRPTEALTLRRREKVPSVPVASMTTDNEEISPSALAVAFDSINRCRYACTRFRRHAEPEKEPAQITAQEGKNKTIAEPTASESDKIVVRQALHCLNIARRAPSGFNSQPYRLLLVSSVKAKEALAKCCHGRNADRVRDSDCTVLFLADREWGRDLTRFGTFLDNGNENNPISKWMKRKIQLLVLLFSSGYPLPRFLAAPISFLVRSIIGFIGAITRRRLLVPTLSSAETWSTKNTMLVAMSYMLAATSRGLATCPMEGVWAPGIKRALGIPRRYAIPLIVSTGTPYHTPTTDSDEADDIGMPHGTGSDKATPRYPLADIVFADVFGSEAMLPS